MPCPRGATPRPTSRSGADCERRRRRGRSLPGGGRTRGRVVGGGLGRGRVLVGGRAWAQPAAAPSWAPKRTWLVVVCVMDYKDKDSFEPFPTERRRDRRLIDLLQQAGVPSDHTLYLRDGKATTDRIERSFAKH